MPPLPLRVVCVSTGGKYGAVYLERLMAMVDRHLAMPHRFVVITDRPNQIQGGIETIDASGWNLKKTHNKLRMYDRSVIDGDPFLYLDVTLLVKRDLAPLVSFGENTGADLVGVSDWHYECLNSCCLWVKPSDNLQSIWDDYRTGVKYATHLPGDQDYTYASLKAHGRCLAYFPPEFVASYKNVRRIHRRNRAKAAKMVEEATILKFHGTPKPHELLEWRSAVRLALMKPGRILTDSTYLIRQIRDWWQ